VWLHGLHGAVAATVMAATVAVAVAFKEKERKPHSLTQAVHRSLYAVSHIGVAVRKPATEAR